MSNDASVLLEANSVCYYSSYDEDAFFEWLRRISCIRRFEGRGRILYITVDPDSLNEEMLRELLALFRRYQIDRRQLKKLARPEFSSWFNTATASWYKEIFGDI